MSYLQPTLPVGDYVVLTRPNEELRAKRELENQGFVVWCPQYEREVIKRDNIRVSDLYRTQKTHSLGAQARKERVKIRLALFPRYIFVRLGWEEDPSSHLVRSTRGCVDLLRTADLQPLAVPTRVMDTLRAREVDGLIVLDDVVVQAPALPDLKHNESVQVDLPGMKDSTARFLRYASNRNRAWVLMNMLGQETMVKVSSRVLKKLGAQG